MAKGAEDIGEEPLFKELAEMRERSERFCFLAVNNTNVGIVVYMSIKNLVAIFKIIYTI